MRAPDAFTDAAAFADLAQKPQDGHRRVVGPALAQVLAVGIDKHGTVLRRPPHLPGLADPRIRFTVPRARFTPAGAFSQADTGIQQAVDLLPPRQG